MHWNHNIPDAVTFTYWNRSVDIILLPHPFWSWVLVRINQDSVAEHTASIIDPEPLIHNYCSLTTNGLVLYEEVNGSASHIRLNYLWKSVCVSVCSQACVFIKRNVAVTCGSMIAFMAFSIFIFNHHVHTYFEGVSRFDLFFPCIINWSLPEIFPLIISWMSTFVYMIKAKNDQNKSNHQHHMF